MIIVGMRPRRYKWLWLQPAIYIFTVAALITPARAVTVSQGFKAKEPLTAGAIVSLDGQSSGSVVLSNPDRIENLIGVVAKPEESLLSLSSSGSETQVATSGVALTIVSNLNGPIKRGDKITASPVNGVGMKATVSTKVVGVAETDYDGTDPDSKPIEVTTKSGQKQKASIGRITVLVDVAYYVAGSGDQQTVIPSAIQKLTDSIAGKRVSAVRIIISGALLVLVFIVITIFVYSAVKSSIISIGRNPLSQSAVRRSLTQVLLSAALVLLVTLGTIYLILSR